MLEVVMSFMKICVMGGRVVDGHVLYVCVQAATI